MKKITFLTIITLLFAFNLKAQTKQKKDGDITFKKFNFNDSSNISHLLADLVAVKNPKGDTLFLINTDMGKSIEEIWIIDNKYKEKPVFIYLSKTELISKFKLYSHKK